MLSDGSENNTMNIDFTITTLKQYLETKPLPKMWSWMEHDFAHDGLLLLHSDSITLQLRLYIEVHHDLSIIVRSKKFIIF